MLAHLLHVASGKYNFNLGLNAWVSRIGGLNGISEALLFLAVLLF
jgi:hypothetical protein